MWFDGATGGGGYYGGESDKNRTIGNAEVHSTERLFQMYLETVGRNATLILNLPPR
jgi:alpha-L-fucosidase